jgi:hypothetical protein
VDTDTNDFARDKQEIITSRHFWVATVRLDHVHNLPFVILIVLVRLQRQRYFPSTDHQTIRPKGQKAKRPKDQQQQTNGPTDQPTNRPT